MRKSCGHWVWSRKKVRNSLTANAHAGPESLSQKTVPVPAKAVSEGEEPFRRGLRLCVAGKIEGPRHPCHDEGERRRTAPGEGEMEKGLALETRKRRIQAVKAQVVGSSGEPGVPISRR